jgi:(1->4)-alpha-D-glucan 1-alpha-D-glucosylmutase
VNDVRATYRLQLHAGFTFDDVASIAPYLKDLGISHVYLSPFLQAMPGSTHGYDVVDHGRLNVELGGQEAYERMCTTLEANGLGQILDIVPNHTAIGGRHNERWWDVLKHGPSSRYAAFFDIDWHAPQEDLAGKVLAPVLGDDLEKVLERGELTIAEEDGETVIKYYEHVFPIAPGDHPAGTDVDLADLLTRQHYLLANWRRAARHLNYRRFFDINELAALRMEVPGVFSETHDLVLRLVEAGHLDGLRVDHIDGLYDPLRYLEELRAASGDDTYIVVEKILEPGERLPASWPVEGTSGYDFMNVAIGALIDPQAENAMTDIYREFTGEGTDIAEVVHEKKFLVMRTIMASDLARLTREAERIFIAEGWLEESEEVLDEARVALAEVIAALPVYRTYISPEGEARPEDRKILQTALSNARARAGHLSKEIFDHFERLLLRPERASDGMAFVTRFQQATGPIMAKGVEDTVFYNYLRFAALNEVGGDPGRFGLSIDSFHSMGSEAHRIRPRSMLATSTHDTKRSEDVRARLAVLSEIAPEWGERVHAWAKMAERHRASRWPDKNAEYLMWQTLVGAWPLEKERAVAYMLKAAKEAKRHTSWLSPHSEYEQALERFVSGVMDDPEITSDVDRFVRELVEPGWVDSLTQTLIKLTYPGVPDTYQGTELWDLSLVDPDNRRPVDYDTRRAVLKRALSMDAAEAWRSAEEGLPKIFLTARALGLRRRKPEAFAADSAYSPLMAAGPAANHAIGYTRGNDIAVVAPRLPLGLERSGWRGTTLSLPDGRWRDEFTKQELAGGPVEIEKVLSGFPVALLVRS